jgi:hypothetical protein
MLTSTRYYVATEQPFRALCPERSGHMNMGYWPASSLKDAQRALVADAVMTCRKHTSGAFQVVDAGSGWGGSARVFKELIPGVRYTGVNSSLAQVQAARSASEDLVDVHYVHADICSYVHEMPAADCLVSIEAAFHFEDKAQLLESLRHKVEQINMLEICVEDPPAVRSRRLLKAALGDAWSVNQYVAHLHEAGFSGVEVHDVSGCTFEGFASYLAGLEPEHYLERAAMLRQFQAAFETLAHLAGSGAVRYVRLAAHAA